MTLVQPIIVKPADHEATVLAAAIASAQMLARAQLSLPSKDHWREWLAGNFTKSVRRAKTDAKFSAVLALRESNNRSHTIVDGAEAVAFEPAEYGQLDPLIAKLQVAGLERPRTVAEGERYVKKGAYVPQVTVTDAVHLSTGKMAAQVAHGLSLWTLYEEPEIIEEWLRWPGASLLIGPLHDEDIDEDDIKIVDSGLTEIPPGTPTVMVRHREISQYD